MNIVNEPVYHRQFGTGMITEQTATMVTVEFCEEHGTKKFLYPSAFETFLKLINPIVKQKINDELREIREREELERQRRTDEKERRQKEELRILLEQKRAAAKKRSSSAKAKTKAKE